MSDHYIRVEDSHYIWVEGSMIGSDEPFTDPKTQCEAFVRQCGEHEGFPGLNLAEDYNNWGCCLGSQGEDQDPVTLQPVEEIFEKGLEAIRKGDVHKPDNARETERALERNAEDIPLLVEAELEAIEAIEEIELLSDEDLAIG